MLATHGRGIWIVDDISPLRALTPEVMKKEATLLPGRPSIQYFDTFGGWAEGDETFNGRSRPADAQITYYQKGRHIFGDLKIEILDQDGKLVDTVAGSKHRGLNRAGWGMRVKPPAVAPAASALFEAAQGPQSFAREVYGKAHQGRSDLRRATGRCDGSASKVFACGPQGAVRSLDEALQGTGTYDVRVAAIEGVRDAANARAAKLTEKDPLRKQLQQLAADCDALRSKIVATKEGGMITGEERIRELLGQLLRRSDRIRR